MGGAAGRAYAAPSSALRPGQGRVLTEGGSQPFGRSCRPRRARAAAPLQLGQRQIGQLRGRVGERAEADAAAGQLPQRRARRCIGSEVDRARSLAKRRAGRASFLPGVVQGIRRQPAIGRKRARVHGSTRSASASRASQSGRVSPRAPSRSIRASRHARRRGAYRQSAIPVSSPRRRSRRPAAPRAGPAASWCSSSLIA